MADIRAAPWNVPLSNTCLVDIEGNKIDTVVVYKVDRLTRSLADFAKIVESFDARGVSFVSVTQQFNTTSSMGRLTLNVLLSFAQFEREVTGERIRDKIAASKRKGMWMGGRVPLGYDLEERRLVINKGEAAQVCEIFRSYLEFGCVKKLKAHLDKNGIRSSPNQSLRARFWRPSPRDRLYGGERGIRTHVRVSPKHAFQACAFNHSASSPTNAFLNLTYDRAAGWAGTIGKSLSGFFVAMPSSDVAICDEHNPRVNLVAELRALLALAIPVALSEIGWMTMTVVDVIMVGKLGPSAIGAVGLGNAIYYAPSLFGIGLLLGLDTLVSRSWGAGDFDDCHRSLAQAMYIALAFTPVLMLFIVFARPLFMRGTASIL